MDRDFWLEKWRINQIGFHEGTPNSLLTAHFAALRLKPGSRVFVPLCGKTRDLSWLRAQGFSVVGIDLSRKAIEQFFDEENISSVIAQCGRLERFDAGTVTLFAGDFFDLDAETLGPVAAIYDRAALIALPPPIRDRYAAHLVALTHAAPQLLVTLEYGQALQSGPPFSVPESDVHALYDTTYRLHEAKRRDVPGGLKGRCPAQEVAWLLAP
ncbi:thiopurine S-methyltransferase [Acetobacter conturbans]|uniref:Thiopurine S-methyltransferase n=1 Tax=Acetobacter conturbans TaxID=1737472 RepID=A0ABX0JYN1_9PROT|nr:thiopurine S-methyltransferase [Acetobacter conturbans]NHN87949.1 thiopurine S-methyltransferase [Acetobacter conturbans]